MQKKGHRTLGSKLAAMALAMLLILGAVALGAGYASYSGELEERVAQTGLDLSRTLSAQPGLEELDPAACRELLRTALEWSGAERLYLIRPEGQGMVLVCAASAAQGEDPYLGGVPETGENASPLLERLGPEGAPRVQRRQVEGEDSRPVTQWRMLTRYDLLRADSSLAACVVAELNMDSVAAARLGYLQMMALVLGLTALALLGGYLLLVRRTVLQPVRMITARAQAYANGERGEASQLKLKSGDELAALADALRMMLVEIDLQGLEQTELTVREQRVEEELKVAAEINAAMLPKALPEGALGFDIRGRVEQAQEFNCSFYDYFLLDQGKLAVVVGETPGEGMSPALFTVVAKTTVKSQMRSGLSLAKAMAAANRQLYEIGQGMALNVLVGVLDQEGVFTYINANERPPMLLRAGDRYDPLNGLVYAPLGQNENVVYQVQTVTLRQGERLFFHTQGLENILNGENRAFGEQSLQASLNLSRSRRLDLDGLLRYISAEGKAFARRPEQVGGFTTVILEYLRTSRQLAHCDITGDMEGAAQMRAFLKKHLKESGMSQRTVAEIVVLAEELLTLCLWQREPGGFLTVECSAPPDGDAVVLRLKGELGGQDPLEHAAASSAGAVEFIRNSARRVEFVKSELGDVLTAEKAVSMDQAAAARS